jgi:hypothetical protein
MTYMKKTTIPILICLGAIAFLTGCGVDVKLGGGTTSKTYPATVGQQLVDLKKAKDAGALNDQEYDTQKAKILSEKQ